MDIQTSKIELAKLILNIDNPIILQKIQRLLQNQEEVDVILTTSEKEEIKIALKQLDSGKRTAFSDYLKKVS